MMFVQRNNSSAITGSLSLITLILCGSTFSAFAKELGTVFSPLSLLFLGEIFIVFFLLFSFGTVPLVRGLFQLKRKEALLICSIGILVTSSLLLFLTGLERTSVANAELFWRSELLFLNLLGFFILHELFKKSTLLGGSIILLGIVLVALRRFADTLTLQIGDILIILSALGFSIVSIILKKWLHAVAPEVVVLCRSGIAILLFFLLSPFTEHTLTNEFMNLPLRLIPVLIGFGFISRFLSILSFYVTIEHLKVSTIAFFSPLTMIGSILFAYWYLGEPVHIYHFIGGGMILIGILLIHVTGMPANEEHAKAHLKQHHRHLY